MKIRNIKIVIIVSFLFLICGLINIQILQAPLYKKLSQGNRIRLIPLTAARGNIYDKEGKILAKSRLSFNVAVIPKDIGDNLSTFKTLARILDTDEASLNKRLKKNALTPFTPAVIAEDIDKDKAFLIEEENLKLKGVMIQTVPLREYPYGESTAHIIGYISELNAEEIKRLKFYGYKPVDLIGRSGIERTLDGYLKGEDGGFQVEVDNRSRQIRTLGYKEPQRGRDIYLTIDIELQDYIYNLMDGRKGAVCIWDPSEGKILAMVSSPSFDPNIFINPDKEKNKAIKRILNDNSLFCMMDRSIQGGYPCGSVFKIVTAVCALETGAIKANEELDCLGSLKVGKRRFDCWYTAGHGMQTVSEALKNSCNVFFYKLSLKVGIGKLSTYARIFGFGEATGINLPSEISGLVPDKKWKRKNKKEAWYDGETVNLSIGQGYILVTPLQVLRMVSVIANGGYLVYPHIVERIGDVDEGVKSPKKLDFKDENLELVKHGMEMVVSSHGTGLRAQVEGLKIAGKTGTAQTGSGLNHAWFVSFFPVDKAKFAMVVFLEHGGSGGVEAAGLSKKITTFIKGKYLLNED